MKKICVFLIFMLLQSTSGRAEEGVSSSQPANDCRECHQAESDSLNRSAHFGVSKEDPCVVCHDDPALHLLSKDKNANILNPGDLSVERGNAICTHCHERIAKDISERFSSVASGHDDIRCFDCHTVHLKIPVSEADMENFRRDLSVDCAGCHDKIKGDLSDSPHGRSGLNCADCHKLHDIKTISADIEEQITRCLSCHPAQELEFKLTYTHPLRERQIKCTDCHSPHSGENEKMLKNEGDEACEDCHADVIIEGGEHPRNRNTNHPSRTVRCLECHKPHGSNFEKLLAHSPDDICTTCHQ